MSDDLVKRARQWDFCWPSSDIQRLVPEMADRIEKLEKERDDYALKLNEANNTYTEMHIALSDANDKLAKAVNITERLRDAWYIRDLMQSDFDRAIAELKVDKT